jgi:WD40 repeat protein
VLEAVSPRLTRTLAHPYPAAELFGLRFSPDGKRVIAGDVLRTNGVVRVWDFEIGTPLTTIETGDGYRMPLDYFLPTPDWETVYTCRRKRQVTRFETDGKKVIRVDCDGDVRAWHLDTGELQATFKHVPPRGIVAMELSPDGSVLLTREELSGEGEDGSKGCVGLWDTQTGQYRTLPEGCSGRAIFSRDSTTIVISSHRTGHYTTALKLFDVATLREKCSIPIAENFAHAGATHFAPDGRHLVGIIQVFPDKGVWEGWRHYLKFWDLATGAEVASFPGDATEVGFSLGVSSPAGELLAVPNWRGNQTKLFLFDVPTRRLLRTVVLPGKVTVWQPAFSPDGRWIAWPTQAIVPELEGLDIPAEDLPQPRIQLIDVAAGEVRETIVAPQGFPGSACFSPDGKTLATSGRGEVLLWDFTVPPGC